MQAFYVSRKGYQEGPHSLELIEDKILSGYLTSQDHIYDPSVNDWVLISKFKLTKGMSRRVSSQDEITQPLATLPPKTKWFLLRGESQEGPYEFNEIVEMLQSHKVYEYDYVWTSSMAAWERLSDCEHFQPEKLKPFLKLGHDGDQKQYRRRSARVELGSSMVLHNHKKLWNGAGFEVSIQGASIEVEGQSFRIGEMLVLHYRPSKMVPAFNAHCEVMSCRATNGANGTPKFRLGLKFIKVNTMARKALRELVAQKAA